MKLFGFLRKTQTGLDSRTTSQPFQADGQTGHDITPQTAQQLLSTHRRAILMDHIWEQTSVSKNTFQTLYQAPIQRYAELVQEFPASESHHHSYLGGMLDHGLELVLYALRLRQSYLLPIGASPEDQAKYADVWTAGVAYGALLHDIGKIICDIRVETDGKAWHPWHGPLKQPYRFQYVKGRDYTLHNAAATVLCTSILGHEVLDWLSGNLQLWGSLLYLLSGHYAEAGVLGEIVSKADRTSTALNIGANPEKALQAPVTSLQAHLIRGLRQLLREEEHRIKLNMKGAAGWLTQDGLWLVSKVVADKLRSFLLSQGVDKVPSKNSALFDELQSHRLIEPNSEGNAIWKARVTEGDWIQEFTFLRVKPSLIWGSDEYPALFTGSVTFDGDTQPDTTASVSVPALSGVPATPSAQAVPEAQSHPVDDIDDVLSLFDEPASAAEPKQNLDNNDAVIPFDDKQTQAVSRSLLANTTDKPGKSDRHENTSLSEYSFHRDMKLESLGTIFIDWLKKGIIDKTLYINDSHAMIHIVDGRIFIVTPAIFQRFVLQFPELEKHNPEQGHPWRWVQKAFERLKLHEKTPEDLNIWKCQVRGPRVKANSVNGYMLNIPLSIVFSFQPVDNPFVTIKQD